MKRPESETRSEEEKEDLIDIPFNHSASLIRPNSEWVEKAIRNQERLTGGKCPSLFSFHSKAGRISWNQEILIHFESPHDFMAFWEFFSLIEFYQYFPSKTYKGTQEEGKKWLEGLEEPASQFFDPSSLFLALGQGNTLNINREGRDLKIFKFIVDNLKKVLPAGDMPINLLHCLPAFKDLETDFLLDPYLSIQPFSNMNFQEQLEIIFQKLESYSPFAENFPYDVRIFFLYESVKQKNLSGSFTSKELANYNAYFLNVNLAKFLPKEDVIIFFDTLIKLKFSLESDTEGRMSPNYSVEQLEMVVNHYLGEEEILKNND
jgi:hypothetical protein